jgi:hypothetical protein
MSNQMIFFQDRSNELTIRNVERGLLNCRFKNEDFCHWNLEKSFSTDDWTFNKIKDQGFTETQYYFLNKANAFKTGPQSGDRYEDKGK